VEVLKLYISDHNRVLAELRNHPDVVETDLLSADAAVVWQDYRGLNRDIVMFCNSIGIPTLVMQHGGNQTREYLPPTDDEPMQFPIFAARAMVWGPIDRDRLLELGYGPERVTLTGATAFDHLPKREKHEGVNIVFFPVKWDAEIKERYTLLKALLEPGKYNVITKITKEYYNVSKFESIHEKYDGRVVATSCDAPGHFEALYDLMRTADLFVLSWNGGTPPLLADNMDIPIVYANISRPRKAHGSESEYHFAAPDDGDVVSDLSRLTEVIDFNLAHPEHRREQRLDTARQYTNFGAGGKAIDRIVATVRTTIENARKDSVKNRLYTRLGPEEAKALSGNVINTLEDKAENSFRSYAAKLAAGTERLILESVWGFPDEYVIVDVPAGADYGHLPFSAENVVSTLIGERAAQFHFDEMQARVADGSVDFIFDTNYPRSLSEIEAKAKEYSRILKTGGELHFFLPNPMSLKSRVKAKLMVETPPLFSKDYPAARGIWRSPGWAGLRQVSQGAIHPWKLYIRTDSKTLKKKLKVIGALYRLFHGVLPCYLGSVLTAVYRKDIGQDAPAKPYEKALVTSGS
jgi:hypothetical protein